MQLSEDKKVFLGRTIWGTLSLITINSKEMYFHFRSLHFVFLNFGYLMLQMLM